MRAVDYVSITSVFDQIVRLSLGRLSLYNVFWSLNHNSYIPLTTSLEGNWLLEAASRELKLLRGSMPH